MQLQSKSTQLDIQHEKLRGQNTQLQVQYTQFQARIQHLEDERKDLLQQLKQSSELLDANHCKSVDEINHLKAQLDARDAEIESLKEEKEEYLKVIRLNAQGENDLKSTIATKHLGLGMAIAQLELGSQTVPQISRDALRLSNHPSGGAPIDTHAGGFATSSKKSPTLGGTTSGSKTGLNNTEHAIKPVSIATGSNKVPRGPRTRAADIAPKVVETLNNAPATSTHRVRYRLELCVFNVSTKTFNFPITHPSRYFAPDGSYQSLLDTAVDFFQNQKLEKPRAVLIVQRLIPSKAKKNPRLYARPSEAQYRSWLDGVREELQAAAKMGIEIDDSDLRTVRIYVFPVKFSKDVSREIDKVANFGGAC